MGEILQSVIIELIKRAITFNLVARSLAPGPTGGLTTPPRPPAGLISPHQRFLDPPLGRTGEEEGYGSPVWCPQCDIKLNSKEADITRAGIKRNQESLHERMVESSSNKFHSAFVGDNVIIPIQRPDRMTSLGQLNLLGFITGVGDSCYTIGARDGTLINGYTRNQFDLCSSKFIQTSTVPCSSISRTSAMRNASLGIEGGSFCRCKYCKTNRCACKKAFRTCNTKCHQGHKCFNSCQRAFVPR